MTHPQVKELLVELLLKDKKMREDSLESPAEWNGKIDIENTKILKQIILKYGWPTISMVGEEASNAAWVIAQHADHDISFQKLCLTLLKQEDRRDINIRNIAYLEDRIRIAENRPQLYGTQFDDADNFRPKSIEDSANLDSRREHMGLEPFDEYAESMKRLFG